MAKYVKVDGMKLDYSRLVYIPPNDGLAIAKFFADQISNLPAADVAPVRHGEWIEDDYAFNRCSECGYEQDFPEITTPYCPNCGAKMEWED
mgnify:CR=1 FL=1